MAMGLRHVLQPHCCLGWVGADQGRGPRLGPAVEPGREPKSAMGDYGPGAGSPVEDVVAVLGGVEAEGDVEPAGTAAETVVEDELVEGERGGEDEAHKGLVLGPVVAHTAYIGGKTIDMGTVRDTADQGVEGGTAIAALDNDGLAIQLAQGIQEGIDKVLEVGGLG